VIRQGSAPVSGGRTLHKAEGSPGAGGGIPDLWLCCTNFPPFFQQGSVGVAIMGVWGEIPFIPLRIPLRRAYLEERGKT
jgi:hypothetical protein